MKDHLKFLRVVFIHTLSAFGGPQSQLGLLIKAMTEQNKYFTANEILDVNLFCQLLPGATATQTITLLGYKRGGVFLGLATLMVWITPAVVFMSLFSFLAISKSTPVLEVLIFIQPVAMAFLCFGSLKTLKFLSSFFSKFIFLFTCIFVILFFQSPWIFPTVIILGSIMGLLSNKKQLQSSITSRLSIRLLPILLFVFIFVSAGILSEQARKNNWNMRTPFNLFENMYRFGSYVFGGADVLIPVMYNQYVVRPESVRVKQFNKDAISVDREVFLSATGVVRAIPGPAFSIASFIGGISMSNRSSGYQLLGCAIGAIAIFLPSFLLGLFFFPLWEHFKQIDFLSRAITGINAAVVGIMFAGTVYLLQDSLTLTLTQELNLIFPYFFIFSISLILLFYTRVSPPFIVLGTILLGLFNYLYL